MEQIITGMGSAVKLADNIPVTPINTTGTLSVPLFVGLCGEGKDEPVDHFELVPKTPRSAKKLAKQEEVTAVEVPKKTSVFDRLYQKKYRNVLIHLGPTHLR